MTIKSSNIYFENLCTDLNLSAGISFKMPTIKLGSFLFDLKNNMKEEFDVPWCKKLIVGAHFHSKKETIRR